MPEAKGVELELDGSPEVEAFEEGGPRPRVDIHVEVELDERTWPAGPPFFDNPRELVMRGEGPPEWALGW